MMTKSYILLNVDTKNLKRAVINNSEGLGGILPLGIISNPVRSSCWMYLLISTSDDVRKEDNPNSFFKENNSWIYPFLKSASSKSTRFPDIVIKLEKLALMNVLPHPGLTPEIISTLLLDSTIAKCSEVRNPRSASIAKSLGSKSASVVCWRIFYSRLFSFLMISPCIEENGIVASTLTPS